MPIGENHALKRSVGTCVEWQLLCITSFLASITAENHFDWSYSLPSALSVLFILFTNREGSQGTQRQQKRGEREKRKTPSQVSSVCLWVLMSWAERIWRGFPAGQQSALNGPAVLCSFWCPSARWAARLCQKKGQTDRSSLHCTQWQCLLFTRGFHSEVTNRLQDNWGEHML